jgi:hypothetical protein
MADRTFRFTICPFADLGKGSSGCHSHDGMQQGIAGSMAYCFAGEVFISEKLKKMREIRRTIIAAPTDHNGSRGALPNQSGIPIRKPGRP